MSDDAVIVGARGPIGASVMLIGERPGETEASVGRPFVGRSGEEQDRYLRRGGLDPFRIRMTNLVKDYAPGNPDPTPYDIERWTPTLLNEIRVTDPQFIIAVGRFAARFLLGDIDMEAVHGLPFRSRPELWSAIRNSIIVIPCYHPAGGFYDDEARTFIAHDYWMAGQYISGRIPAIPVVDEHPDPVYLDLTGAQLRDIIEGYDADAMGAFDTEGVPGDEWSIQLSLEPGTGFVLRTSQLDFDLGIGAISAHFMPQDREPEDWPLLIVQNLMYDYEMTAGMGLDLFEARIFDTRYAAYILRTEPQGLKYLAPRWTGMVMKEYSDVVGPIGLEKQLAYLGTILEVGGWEKPQPRIERENDGTARLYTPQPVERRAEAILTDFYSEKLDKNGNRCDPYRRWRGVDPLLRRMVEKHLGPMPVGTLADIPLADSVYYAGRDPDATLRLYRRLAPVLSARNLTQLMQDGNDVLPVFEEMQCTGILADAPYFRRHWSKMDAECAKLQSYISHHYFQDRPFNPNSDDQVRIIMRRRGLTGEKRTKKTKQVSTSKKSIEHLRFEDDAVSHIIDWKEHAKMRDSFDAPIIERLEELEVERGRIRTSINPYKVVSRRVSSSDPNLTAIPVRNELGVEVRDGFVAEEGCELGSWDLSQIEMRYMAHESRDPLLVRFFTEKDPATGKDRDVHAETASRIFGIPLADVKEMEHRYPAKRAGFGIITNIQGTGLYDQLRMFGCKGWSEDRCDELIREWLKVYGGVNRFMQEAKAEAHRYGYVKDCWGMERPLPGVYSSDRKVVAEAERAASSMKIQGGAQGMIQRSMIWLKPYIRAINREIGHCKWILQIHDECIVEFRKDLWETVDPLMIEGLTEHSLKLIVPVKAKGNHAESWGKLK